MTRVELEERVARAICMDAGCVWDEDHAHPNRREWLSNARAAIAIVGEACAHKATSFLVGSPDNDVPLRNPMAHEIAEAIRALTASQETSHER